MPGGAAIRIVEVSPRDGLQNEAMTVPVSVRVALIEALVAAGLRTIEAGSFVSARWVPQMAGTAEVLARLPPRDGVSFPVLVPNLRGLEAARAAGATDISVFAAASERFSLRNVNCSIADSLDRLRPVCTSATASGLRVRGYVSCVLGCPYEGAVPIGKVVEVAASLAEMGCHEVSLGDTIGVGTPLKAREMLRAVSESVPMQRLAVHFHDTYGQALANVLACLDAGVTVVDAAAGGLGGCPYAAGATGNLATEELVFMLDGMGVETRVSLEGVLSAARLIASALGREPGSRLARARSPAQ